LLLTHNQQFMLHDAARKLIADWAEPSLDELVAQIEYAYHHRDALKPVAEQAGSDMQRYTWARAAEKVLEMVYPNG
jgi:ABC-type taurine transport system substrate-binding protein